MFQRRLAAWGATERRIDRIAKVFNQDDTTLKQHEEEEFVFKCVFGDVEDDGNIVSCDGCGTWQQIKC
jgi:hypothetical protein